MRYCMRPLWAGLVIGLGLVLLVGGVLTAAWGLWVISLVFRAYKDSTDITYLVLGGFILICGLGIAGLGVLFLTSLRRHA